MHVTNISISIQLWFVCDFNIWFEGATQPFNVLVLPHYKYRDTNFLCVTLASDFKVPASFIYRNIDIEIQNDVCDYKIWFEGTTLSFLPQY